MKRGKKSLKKKKSNRNVILSLFFFVSFIKQQQKQNINYIIKMKMKLVCNWERELMPMSDAKISRVVIGLEYKRTTRDADLIICLRFSTSLSLSSLIVACPSLFLKQHECVCGMLHN